MQYLPRAQGSRPDEQACSVITPLRVSSGMHTGIRKGECLITDCACANISTFPRRIDSTEARFAEMSGRRMPDGHRAKLPAHRLLAHIEDFCQFSGICGLIEELPEERRGDEKF